MNKNQVNKLYELGMTEQEKIFLDAILASRRKALESDKSLLEVIKALIVSIQRIEREFAEYRHNQQYPPVPDSFNEIDLRPKGELSIDEFIKAWTMKQEDN